MNWWMAVFLAFIIVTRTQVYELYMSPLQRGHTAKKQAKKQAPLRKHNR